MSVYGQDTFSRANQSGWGTASDGQTWSGGGSYTLAISGNEGTATGQTSVSEATFGSKNVTDLEILVRFSVSNTAAGAGVFFRGATNNQYRVRYQNGSFFLSSVVASTQTNVAVATFTVTANSFYWIRARMIGSTLFGKIWASGTAEPDAWTLGALNTVTDTNFTSGGYGLYLKGNTAGDTISYDSFYAIDYVWSDGLSASDSFLGTDVFIPTDALTISDIGGGSLQSWNVDALTITDSVLFTDSAIPVDALLAQDALLSTDSASFTEANSASDSISGNSGFVSSDNLSIADAFSAQDSYSTTESLSALDAFLAQNGASWVDVLPIADSLSLNGVFIPVESLSALDTLLSTDAFSSTEANSISDGFLGQGVYIPVDSLTLADLQSALQSWGVDGLVISDSFSTIGTFAPTEGLSAVDSLLAGDSVLWVDVVPISDSFSGASSLPPAIELTVVIARSRDGIVVARSRDGLVAGRGR